LGAAPTLRFANLGLGVMSMWQFKIQFHDGKQSRYLKSKLYETAEGAAIAAAKMMQAAEECGLHWGTVTPPAVKIQKIGG